MRSWKRPFRGTALAAALLAAVAAAPAPAAPKAPAAEGPTQGRTDGTGTSGGASGDMSGGAWTAAWGAGLHRPVPPLPWSWPNWAWDGFADQSLRQTVRVAAEGSQLRIRLSNRYGHRPLHLARATVARAGQGAAVRPGTVRELRFDGRGGTVVPVGSEQRSDPVRLPVRALEKVTVTFHFAAGTGPATFHEDGLATAHRAVGDRTREISGDAFGETSESHYLLSGVEVRGARNEGAVVAFGDSITDGYGSTPGADRRYPDRLAERLLADGRRLGVVNAGISGNMLLTDSACYGDRGAGRFRHDVLGRAGVRTAVVLIGINDIGGGGLADRGCGHRPAVDAKQLVEGHRKLIRDARRHGVTVVGATLTPFRGYAPYYTPEKEAVRDAVNHWIRTSGAYDAVVDLDRLLADPRPGHGDALAPAYDSGDGIHPGDAGMDAIAEAVAARIP
ncbi:SGNH/GDSL hydrolase family protein [Streptomyces sp. NPDC014894]|uniref:SGNH/GDSL hydrolase family protein n=1 Tax=Streptomyces sp. NPDC014894 TaxID=3364931 RepID=UPI0036FAC601